MIWTHLYDLLLKMTCLILAMIFFVQVPLYGQNSFLIITSALVVGLSMYHFWVRTLATYLYCRIRLGMRVSLPQAKTLNEAFSPLFSITREWLPMREIRQLDHDEKYETALTIYNVWKTENEQKRTEQKERMKNSSSKTKFLRAILYVLLGYFTLAAFVNIPPASFISDFMINQMKSGGYYPMLNMCILILPTALLFKLIDKDVT